MHEFMYVYVPVCTRVYVLGREAETWATVATIAGQRLVSGPYIPAHRPSTFRCHYLLLRRVVPLRAS